MCLPRTIAAVIAFSLLGACSKKDEEPFFHWKLEQSDRESIRGAQVSEEQDIDTDYVVHLADNVDITLHVHGKTAKVTYTEDGAQEVRRAPVSLELMAPDNHGFSLSVVRCIGPHYMMVQPTPEDMILACTLRATGTNADLMSTFWVHGDGKVDDGQPSGMQ